MATLHIRDVRGASLAGRIWDLRDNMWPYDAAFVALAEVLDVPLVTVDGKFTRTTGIRCRVEVIS